MPIFGRRHAHATSTRTTTTRRRRVGRFGRKDPDRVAGGYKAGEHFPKHNASRKSLIPVAT